MQEKVLKWAEDYDKAVSKAIKTDPEVAIKAIQWAYEHVRDADGVTVVDASVDKQQAPVASGPTIKIGFQLGGLATIPKQALPPASIEAIETEVIDVRPIDAVDAPNYSDSSINSGTGEHKSRKNPGSNPAVNTTNSKTGT